MVNEREELIAGIGALSTGELADNLLSMQSAHEAQLAELHDDNDALWDKVDEQGARILAAQLIHTEGYTGKCGTCNKQRHPGPCATSVALGATD